jgi:hypothetical protein
MEIYELKNKLIEVWAAARIIVQKYGKANREYCNRKWTNGNKVSRISETLKLSEFPKETRNYTIN